MNRLYCGSRVALVQARGEEPRCPRCGGRNALLHVGRMQLGPWGFEGTQVQGSVEILECRDCHQHLIREPGAAEATVVSRRLGKTCGHCGSFEMREMTHPEVLEAIRIFRLEGKRPESHPNWICNECDYQTRY